MSDHDALKEWTHTHSVRHGPQQYLSARRKQWRHTISGPIQAIVRLRHPASQSQSQSQQLHAHHVRRSSADAAVAGPHSHEEELDSLTVPAEDIEEGTEDQSEAVPSDAGEVEDLSVSAPSAYHADYFPLPPQSQHLRAKSHFSDRYARYATMPHDILLPMETPRHMIVRSLSDADFNSLGLPVQTSAVPHTHHTPHHHHSTPYLHCATCLQMESSSTLNSPSAVGGGGAFDYSSLSTRSAQAAFSPFRFPPPMPFSHNAGHSPMPALHSARGQVPSQSPSAVSTPASQARHSVQPTPTAAAAAPTAVSKSADPILESVPVPPAGPPAPPPLSSLLPRWFLILLAILRETDGRDKLTKVIQYGGRTIRNALQRMPTIAWWADFIYRNLEQGSSHRITHAARVLIWEGRLPPAVNAAVPVPDQAPIVSYSTALATTYASETAATRQKLSAIPLYSGTIARLDVLTAALSSARRIFRTCKWTYTLPGWAKAFHEWRRQVAEGIEQDLQRQQAEEAKAEEQAAQQQAKAEEQAAQQQAKAEEQAAQQQAKEQEKHADSPAVDAASPAAPPAAPVPFRFSHPHPRHVWRRLPWLASVELLDLSIAVATDCADDLEWLSKYNLFPGELGYKFGRISQILWFTTVVLDLTLTYRIIRHYRYQSAQLRQQIETARVEYETCSRNLADLEARQEERAHRRLVRQLTSPYHVQRQQQHLQSLHEKSAEDSLRLLAESAALASAVETQASGAASSGSSSSAPMSNSIRSDASGWSVLSDPASRVVGADSGPSSNSSSASPSRDAPEADHKAATAEAHTDADNNQHAHDDALVHDAANDHLPDSDADEQDDDGAAVSTAHASTVLALHRLTDLHHQLSATRHSQWLQTLNFAKLAADSGCAFPMSLNVHKEWDGVVQMSGLISGVIAMYKLVNTIKPYNP